MITIYNLTYKIYSNVQERKKSELGVFILTGLILADIV